MWWDEDAKQACFGNGDTRNTTTGVVFLGWGGKKKKLVFFCTIFLIFPREGCELYLIFVPRIMACALRRLRPRGRIEAGDHLQVGISGENAGAEACQAYASRSRIKSWPSHPNKKKLTSRGGKNTGRAGRPLLPRSDKKTDIGDQDDSRSKGPSGSVADRSAAVGVTGLNRRSSGLSHPSSHTP